MYGVKNIATNFSNKSITILQILDSTVNEPKTIKRDVLIEGLFLKIIIHWENFLEEYFLSSLCRCKSKSNVIIRPKVPPLKNKDEAFKRLSPNRRGRESEYLDWLDYHKIKERCNDYFHPQSRLHFIYSDPNMLTQIQVIRNQIAHNSYLSLKKFRDMIINNYGYLPVVDPNVADILISVRRTTNQYFYKIYYNYIESVFTKLIK